MSGNGRSWAWKVSGSGRRIERMFDLLSEGPPEDWEPIPASVFAEIGPWGEEDLPAGLVPLSTGPDDLVWQALSRSLGADTLPLLTATPYEALTDQGRSLALRRLDELSAHLEAVKAELTGLIAGPKPATAQALRDEFSAHEVSVATRCSVYTADAKIAFARDLAGRLTATLEAMHRGEISWAQARALSEGTCHLDVDTAREVEAKLLRFCHRQDLSLFKASLRRWLAKLDPEFTPARPPPARNAWSSTPRTATAPASCSCAARWRSPPRSTPP